MGLLDRLHDSLTGLVGGVVEAPVGVVVDLAKAPFTDDEYGGILNTLYRSPMKHFGQGVGDMIGPEGFTGSLIGGLPEQVRNPIGDVYESANNAMEWVYREGVSQPLSTAVTAASMAGAERFIYPWMMLDPRNPTEGWNIGGLFNPETWAEAYNIAEHRSPGQSTALAFMTKDIRDPRQVQKAQGTDMFNIASGTIDAATRLGIDPTQLAGGRLAAGWQSIHNVSTVEAIAKAESAGRIRGFAEKLTGMNAAEIRHTYFPKHAQGADIATALAEAGTTDEVHRTLRILMGATDEVEALRATRADLALKLDDLMQQRQMVKTMSDNGFWLANDAEDIANLDHALDLTHPKIQRYAHDIARADALDMHQGAIRELPNMKVAELRSKVTQSAWYQKNATSKPLRTVHDMLPHRFVRLDDPTGDVQVWRMMQRSDLPLDRQQALRAEYMAANEPAGRLAVLEKAQNEAVESIAKNAGMTREEIDKVLMQASKRRKKLHETITSRKYDAERGQSSIMLDMEDGTAFELTMREQPLWETQLAEMATLDDMDEIRRATRKIGEWRMTNPAAIIPEQMLNGLYRVWRPAVLLRAGWPIRVVGDEQLRLMAKLGTLTQTKNLGLAFGDAFRTRKYNKLAKVAAEDAKEMGLAGEEAAAFIRSAMDDAKAPRLMKSLQYKDYTFEGPFGSPGDGWNIYRQLNSSRASFGKIFGETGDDLDELYKTGQWMTLSPTDAGYQQAWSHAVNHQIGQSALARKIIESEGDREAVVHWLATSTEGARVRAKMPMRRNLDEWVDQAAEQIDYYLPTPELKQAALKRNATFGELESLFPDAAARPNVHGEILTQTLGEKNLAMDYLQKGTDRLFTALGSAPSDQLSRNNYFYDLYNNEVKRLVDLRTAGGRELSELDVADVQTLAREYALGEVKDLLYDLAEESRLADMLRFVSPFYSAWQEVITRWGGLAAENPAFVRRAQLVWQAPDKAGLVQDEHGNTVDERGIITHAVEGYTVGQKSPSGERIIVAPVSWFHDFPGLQNASKVSFPKASLNLALSGAPGAGPMVAIPANAIAKENPEIADSIKFILPFGATQNSTDILMPGWARKLNTATKGEDDRKFTGILFRIYNDKMVDYNLGKREKAPTYEEARKEAQAFANLNFAASWISPVSLSAKSPYQFYIDALRGRKEWDANLTPEQKAAPDYQDPEDWFLTEFGEEYFPLTQSISHSIDGVPPTLEGRAARQKYQSLIEDEPELGRLIIGEEGAGEFNRSVYEAQLASKVAPGSSQNQREVDSFENFSARGPVSLGWRLYSNTMDAIDLARTSRGLTSLNVKGAEDLRAMKESIITMIANDPKYGGSQWYSDYANADRSKWDKRINGMTKIAASKAFSDDRRDIAGLREYLKMRNVVLLQLAGAESQTLSARSNASLASSWDVFVNSLVERNPAFASLYYRWLENDPVLVTPISASASQGALV